MTVTFTTLFPGTPIADSLWCEASDGDPVVFDLFRRHYSYRRSRMRRFTGRKFIGPGAYMVLITPENGAIFGWRKFRSMDRQEGICCCFFRNERPDLYRSSDLIRAADVLAWRRWPHDWRHYTYVNPRKVKSRNPGCCFKKAGWHVCGLTRKSLIILERTP